jgi:hypothetical protein
MKPYSIWIALALTAAAHGAHAAEFQSPIAFDKPSYSKGDTAVASIKGKGQCKNIEIDWGDGQKSSLGDFAFGQQAGVKVLNANHQYNTPGNFNVQVKSAGGGGGHCAPVTGSLMVKQPGQLTGIAFDKTSINEGEVVKITLNGSGECATNTLLNAQQTVPAGGPQTGHTYGKLMDKAAPWPRTVYATLSSAGKYEFKVVQAMGDGSPPQSDACHGAGQGVAPIVNVAKPAPAIQLGSASQMAAIINNGNCPNPEITGGLGAFKPNGAVAIGGCKFGASVGQVWLRNMGTGAGGSDVQVIVDSWTDTGIGIKIPAIEGTPEKEVTLDVVTSNGVHIKKPVTFKPEIVTRLLKKSDFPNVDCSANNMLVKDTCVATNQPYQGQNCGFTVCAQHKIPSGIVIPTPVKAADAFAMNLKHGWKYEKASLGFTNSGADFNGVHTMPVGPQPKGENSSGGTSVNYKVTYALPGSGSWVEYKLDIYVTGPKGVPYQ